MSKNLKGKKVFQMPAAQMLLETTFFGIACLVRMTESKPLTSI